MSPYTYNLVFHWSENVHCHLDAYAFLWNDLHFLKSIGDEIHTYHQICDPGNDEKREEINLDEENQQSVNAIPSLPGYDKHKIGCNKFIDLHILRPPPKQEQYKRSLGHAGSATGYFSSTHCP